MKEFECVFVQVAREAHFSGQSYLDLALSNIPTLRNNFYASFSFRTEQQEGLLFYHRDQVTAGTTSCFLYLPAPSNTAANWLLVSTSMCAGWRLSGLPAGRPPCGKSWEQRDQDPEDL